MTHSQYRNLAGALPLAHIALCVATLLGSSEGSWGWFVVFLADFPFSILVLPVANVVGPFPAFVTLGSLWWYGLSRVLLFLLRKVLRWQAERAA